MKIKYTKRFVWYTAILGVACYFFTIPFGFAQTLSLNEVLQALPKHPESQRQQSELLMAQINANATTQSQNPVLKWSSEKRWEISQNITPWLLYPQTAKLKDNLYAAAQSQQRVQQNNLELTVKQAYWDYAAATQHATLQATIAEAANLSIAFAERFFAAGNISQLRFEEIRADAYAQTRLAQLATGESQQARQALNVWILPELGRRDWEILSALPVLPATMPAFPALETLPMVSAAQAQSAAAIQQNRVAKTQQWLQNIELGVEQSRNENTGHDERYLLVQWTLPVFASGKNAQRLAAQYTQQAALTAQQTEYSSGLQKQYLETRLQQLQQQAQQLREHTIPAQRAVLDGIQRETNYMLKGVFDLLAARQAYYGAWHELITVLHAFWRTVAEWEALTGQTLVVPYSKTLTLP